MPTIQSAKQIAENALSTIGAFPASRSAPDPGEMKKALRWLEMLLNHQAAIRPVGSFWRVFDIDLEENIGDYDLADYADESGVCHVFSVSLVNSNGETDPLGLEYQSRAALENLSQTGRPLRATVTHADNVNDGILSVYPTPTSVEVDAGLKLRVRAETFHTSIDENSTGTQILKLRPSWYLWITKRLGYELGSGPVRRLAEGELGRLEKDSMRLENELLARDGQNMSPRPPVTESMDIDDNFDTGAPTRNGYFRRN